jgi:hypothetical protein
MANKILEQKLVDSQKRALLKYVLVGDGSAQANTTLVDASSLAFSLNTNGYIMTSNTDPKSVYRTTVNRLWGHAKANGVFKLSWGGTANNEIVVFGNGQFDYTFDFNHGGGAIPNNDPSPTGDILLSTSPGMGATDSFTLFIDLRKDNRDFDAGQTADPMAFNKGTRNFS